MQRTIFNFECQSTPPVIMDETSSLLLVNEILASCQSVTPLRVDLTYKYHPSDSGDNPINLRDMARDHIAKLIDMLEYDDTYNLSDRLLFIANKTYDRYFGIVIQLFMLYNGDYLNDTDKLSMAIIDKWKLMTQYRGQGTIYQFLNHRRCDDVYPIKKINKDMDDAMYVELWGKLIDGVNQLTNQEYEGVVTRLHAFYGLG